MNLTRIIITTCIFFGLDVSIPYTEIETMFIKKNADTISKIGDENILISMFGKEKIYSNSQSKIVINDFFKQFSYSSFKFIFKSKENDAQSYAIANYYEKNETLRITFHFKKVASIFKISKLIIEKN